MSSLKKILKSFYFAYEGFKFGFLGRNFKVHLLISFLVIIAGVFFQISVNEWLIILMLIGLVISAELFNTAIEEICNILKEKLKLDYFDTWHPRNLSAAAVLILAVISALIGLIIFVPKILG